MYVDACLLQRDPEAEVRALPCQSYICDFFTPSSGTCTLPPALLDNGDYDKADGLSTVQERVLPP
jgi:hypothetical protein